MISIIICDDDKTTRERYKEIIDKFYMAIGFKNYEILSFDNSSSTLCFIKSNLDKNYIYILDIDLNEKKNGLMLGKEIREMDKYHGEMIFITNYTEMGYKVFQYKLRVLEFIDKNYDLNKELKESLSIASKILLNKSKNTEEKLLNIKFGTQSYNVPIKDIIFLETIKGSKKLLLHTSKNRFEFYGTIKELKNSLDESFIHIHKTTIVNKNYIKCINTNIANPYVELKTGEICSLSRNGLKEVKKYWI